MEESEDAARFWDHLATDRIRALLDLVMTLTNLVMALTKFSYGSN